MPVRQTEHRYHLFRYSRLSGLPRQPARVRWAGRYRFTLKSYELAVCSFYVVVA